MGSLSLVCPMCCGETFDDSQSLKYHLLSMTDNLYCPNCADRFDSVAALIQHLDNCGRSHENPDDAHKSGNNGSENIVSLSRTDASDCGFLATVDDDGNVVLADSPTVQNKERAAEAGANTRTVETFGYGDEEKTGVFGVKNFSLTENGNEKKVVEIKDEQMDKSGEVAVAEDASDVIMDGERLEDQSEAVGVENEGLCRAKREICQEESEALYSCSSCGMSFNSVLEHIKDYHDGQEVVLEMAEQQMEQLPNEVESSSVGRVTSEERSSGCDIDVRRSVDSVTSVIPARHRQTMNTLRTEECVDSEGRLYTRKVVQIERFWDRSSVGVSQFQLQQHQQPVKSGPMIEKFFSNVEGVKVTGKSSGSNRIVVDSTSTQKKMYRCYKCLEEFGKMVEFRVHACSDGNNQCDICDETFASVKALQSHSRIHEGDIEVGDLNKQYICPICATEFASHKSLRLHSRMHAPVRARHVDAPLGTHGEFTCHECGKTLSESYRKAHTALHKGESATCSVCNRKFDSPDSLAMHATVHIDHIEHSQQSQQEVQQDRFNDKSQPHVDNQGPVKSTQSSIEDVSTMSSILTSDVIEEKLKESQKPYQCQHCGRRFMRPHEKVKHERIHTGEKPHACEVCGKTFRVSYCLTLHMRTHTGVRPYACQHCGKRFKASSVYNHHLLTHGDKRAYTCPYCPKTFKTRVQLAGHKNSHTKPFRCTECSRPFASLYAARAHIQTHKKDNNFKFSCYICGASYGRAFALKDHLKVHAAEDVIAPPEPARVEELPEPEDYLISHEIEQFDQINQTEDDNKKLVSAAADATTPTSSVILYQPNE